MPGGCHSTHLSYGRDALILQEYPHDGVIVLDDAVGTGMGMAVFGGNPVFGLWSRRGTDDYAGQRSRRAQAHLERLTNSAIFSSAS